MELSKYKRTKSKELKYLKIADKIVDQITKNYALTGARLPSIYQQSLEFKVSRETILKTYSHLKKKKVIKVVQGKGHYLMTSGMYSGVKVLCLFDNLSDVNIHIYNALIDCLNEGFRVDFKHYFSDIKALNRCLSQNLLAYDYFVILPGFLHAQNAQPAFEELKAIAARINPQKFFYIDRYLTNDIEELMSVRESLAGDLHNSLVGSGKNWKRQYDKMVIVNPGKNTSFFHNEIVYGLMRYAEKQRLQCEIFHMVPRRSDLKPRQLFVLIDDTDLVQLLNTAKSAEMKIGEDIGIVSCDDHPMKELLGISTFCMNQKAIVKAIACMIKNGKKEKEKLKIYFYDRGSA